MSKLRAEEEWVAACLRAALPEVTVEQHDDNSSQGMYDLSLADAGGPFGACEITAAADPESIELWNLLNGADQRWIEPSVLGGWMVTVSPDCRAKPLKEQLPGLLRELEQADKEGDRADVISRLQSLAVVAASQGGTAFPGSIYLTIQLPAERAGGAVANTGNGLLAWLNDWLLEPKQASKLDKLDRSQLPERHLYILLPGFTSAPFSASDLLMRDDAPLPTAAPSIPSQITHLWLMSTWNSGDIFHWCPSGWQRFKKVEVDD